MAGGCTMLVTEYVFFIERGAVWRLLFDGVSASCIDWRHVLVMECVRDDVSRLDVPGMKRGSDGL
jgi:hypothetical protein